MAKQTIRLSKPWDYIPNKQHHRNFPAGEHEVSQAIYDAAVKAGVHEEEKPAGKPAPEPGKPAGDAPPSAAVKPAGDAQTGAGGKSGDAGR